MNCIFLEIIKVLVQDNNLRSLRISRGVIYGGNITQPITHQTTMLNRYTHSEKGFKRKEKTFRAGGEAEVTLT